MTFIDELLAEAEVKDKEQLLQMNRLRADQMLAALMVLEQQAEDVNKLADDETAIIETYRTIELGKIEKKMSWLEYNLEQFIRSTKDKTINLPHGALRLRMGRDKIEITDMEKFIPVAERKGLLKHIPESFEPDMQKVLAYVRQGGILPPGASLTPAQSRFSYTTLKGQTKNGNGQEKPSEA